MNIMWAGEEQINSSKNLIKQKKSRIKFGTDVKADYFKQLFLNYRFWCHWSRERLYPFPSVPPAQRAPDCLESDSLALSYEAHFSSSAWQVKFSLTSVKCIIYRPEKTLAKLDLLNDGWMRKIFLHRKERREISLKNISGGNLTLKGALI